MISARHLAPETVYSYVKIERQPPAERERAAQRQLQECYPQPGERLTNVDTSGYRIVDMSEFAMYLPYRMIFDYITYWPKNYPDLHQTVIDNQRNDATYRPPPVTVTSDLPIVNPDVRATAHVSPAIVPFTCNETRESSANASTSGAPETPRASYTNIVLSRDYPDLATELTSVPLPPNAIPSLTASQLAAAVARTLGVTDLYNATVNNQLIPVGPASEVAGILYSISNTGDERQYDESMVPLFANALRNSFALNR